MDHHKIKKEVSIYQLQVFWQIDSSFLGYMFFLSCVTWCGISVLTFFKKKTKAETKSDADARDLMGMPPRTKMDINRVQTVWKGWK